MLINLVNQLVWNVRRGHGSFLTVEFGAPYLNVREPKVASPDSSETTRKLLRRRHVSVVGTWHFWIMHGRWTLTACDQVVSSDETDHAKIAAVLVELDGQRLVSVSHEEDVHRFAFDLGGDLRIGRSEVADTDDERWQLFHIDGDVLGCRNDGHMSHEQRRG